MSLLGKRPVYLPEQPYVDQQQSQIQDLIDEANRNADQLDALNTSLKIIARGVVVCNYDAGSNSYPTQSVSLSSGASNSFLAYMVRSDQPNTVYQVPYFECAGGGGGPVTLQIASFSETFQGSIYFGANISTGYASPPASLTFYYFMIQQPANAVTT